MLRKPDLANALRKPRTLLLIGGVFGFGISLACFFANNRIVSESAAGVPENAIAIIKFDRGLPVELQEFPFERVEVGGDSILIGKDGKIYLIARNREKTVRRIIPKNADGFGSAILNGAVLPITASVTDDRIIVRVGRGFRGISSKIGKDVVRHAVMTAIPNDAALYYSDRNPAESIKKLSERVLFRPNSIEAGAAGIFASLHGSTQAFFLSQADSLLNGFAIHSSGGADSIDTDALDKAIGAVLGVVDPHIDTILLPDQTTSTERRDSSKDVALFERVNYEVVTKKLTSTSGKAEIVYAIDATGDLWMGDSAGRAQEALTNNSMNFKADGFQCSREFSVANLFINTQVSNKLNFPGFKAIGISVNDLESGLFTVCGYFR